MLSKAKLTRVSVGTRGRLVHGNSPRHLRKLECLNFLVGPAMYSTQVSTRTLSHPKLGDDLLGYASSRSAYTGQIVVASKSPDRLVTLGHELAHAWLWLVGRLPRNDEQLCDFCGTMAAQMIRNLDSQGGLSAFEQIQWLPLEIEPDGLVVVNGDAAEGGSC